MGQSSSNANQNSNTPSKGETHVDIVFVMGLCGAGKTTLIQQMTCANIAASHGTSAGTIVPELTPAYISPKHPFIFIEIPGFNDPERSDADIINELWNWINQVDVLKHATISGLIYVHDIQTERFQGSHLKVLKLLEQMSGPGFEKNICIATTKWGILKPSVQKKAEKREKELAENQWSDLLKGGAKLWRVNTRDLDNDSDDDDGGVMEMNNDERKEMQEEFWGKFQTRDPNIVMTMQQEMRNGVSLKHSKVASVLGIDPQSATSTASSNLISLMNSALIFALQCLIVLEAIDKATGSNKR